MSETLKKYRKIRFLSDSCESNQRNNKFLVDFL